MLTFNKSTLGDGLWTSTSLPIRSHYVLDGDALLHIFSWPISVLTMKWYRHILQLCHWKVWVIFCRFWWLWRILTNPWGKKRGCNGHHSNADADTLIETTTRKSALSKPADTDLLVGPILDDRLKEKLLKGALCSHFQVYLSVCSRATGHTFWPRNLIFGLIDPWDMRKKRIFF